MMPLRDWVGKLRTGDPGALPSVLGLIVLALIFMQVSDRFLSAYNLGNLPGQGSYIALIALGLVFVLLLGEIDLSAGTAGGTCAAIAAGRRLLRQSPPGPARVALLEPDRRDGRCDRAGHLAQGLQRCGGRPGRSGADRDQPDPAPDPRADRGPLHRCSDRGRQRLPGRQGRHPQLRGHPGPLPRLAGRAAVRPRRPAGEHLQLRALARPDLRQPQPPLELGLRHRGRGRLRGVHRLRVGQCQEGRARPGQHAARRSSRCRARGRRRGDHPAGQPEPQHQPVQGHPGDPRARRRSRSS